MTGRRPDSEVEIEGLEPSLTEPESVVLPLHHISISRTFPNGIANLQLFSVFAKFLGIIFVFLTDNPQLAQNIPGLTGNRHHKTQKAGATPTNCHK